MYFIFTQDLLIGLFPDLDMQRFRLDAKLSQTL